MYVRNVLLIFKQFWVPVTLLPMINGAAFHGNNRKVKNMWSLTSMIICGDKL